MDDDIRIFQSYEDFEAEGFPGSDFTVKRCALPFDHCKKCGGFHGETYYGDAFLTQSVSPKPKATGQP